MTEILYHILFLFASFSISFLFFLPLTPLVIKKSAKALDKCEKLCYSDKNRIQTVEAEIKPIMPSQRACGAEMQVGNKSEKWAAEGAVKGVFFEMPSILQRVGAR